MVKNKKEEENLFYCAKCDQEMKFVILPSYEFEESMPLTHVEGYKCTNCNQLFFTEEQAKTMEKRTEHKKQEQFGFKRTITISGKSLVLGIPSELAQHLRIKQGTMVKILPIERGGFLVEKM